MSMPFSVRAVDIRFHSGREPLCTAEYSKQYLRALELYGGQANVLAYEIREWFVGLWHGKSLACIIAGIAILAALAVSYGANRLPP
jgi:hypothetical protein